MAYRTVSSEGARASKPRETFTYVPQPRGCLAWLLDAAVIVAIVALALLLARRTTVSCDWPAQALGRCTMTTENALGSTQTQVLDGAHSFAYRAGNEIGFVTDAKNKDRDAPFGTRSIPMWDQASADTLMDFATERKVDHVEISHGPDHPVRVGLLFLGLLVLYVLSTRRPAYAITVDRKARMLFVSPRAWFGETKRFELNKVRAVEVENRDVAQHRVRVVLEDDKYVPITPIFTPGAHHSALAKEVSDALLA
jgi:hypothetical protein